MADPRAGIVLTEIVVDADLGDEALHLLWSMRLAVIPDGLGQRVGRAGDADVDGSRVGLLHRGNNHARAGRALAVPYRGHPVAFRTASHLGHQFPPRGPSGGVFEQVVAHLGIGLDAADNLLRVHAHAVRLRGRPGRVPGFADADGDQAFDIHFVGVHQQAHHHLRIVLLGQQVGEQDHAVIAAGGMEGQQAQHCER